MTAPGLHAARQFAADIGAHGDTLLYSGKPQEAANMAASLACAIALMAFAPGGIDIFGQHWEAQS